MLQLLPPNIESTIATAKLALQYIDEGKYDIAKIVVQNVIDHLKDPHFGKSSYPHDQDTIITYTKEKTC
jgi:hypothetical protein